MSTVTENYTPGTRSVDRRLRAKTLNVLLYTEDQDGRSVSPTLSGPSTALTTHKPCDPSPPYTDKGAAGVDGETSRGCRRLYIVLQRYLRTVILKGCGCEKGKTFKTTYFLRLLFGGGGGEETY